MQKQTACRIEVRDVAARKPAWDSGWVESDQSVLVPYEGAKGGYTIDTNREMYVSDMNLFASDPSSRLQAIAAPTPTPSLYGQQSNSVFATEAYLANLPGFNASIEGMGLSTRSVLKIPTDQGIKPLYVRDIVEINGDSVRDLPTIPVSTLEAWPDPNVYVYPFCRP